MDPFLLNVFFSLLNYVLVLFKVFAVAANTILVASFAVSKTFTVHFEAKGLFAGTSNASFLSRAGGRLGFLYS